MKEKKLMPLVSVCVPAYNHEKYVAECIQSIIDQDYKNIELIIINDGSKDKTDEVIKSYEQKCQERFVRFEYRNRQNKGLSSTLNEMLDWSKGKYFTGIASDDILLFNKISLLVYELEKLGDSYAVAFGNAKFIDDNSKELYLDKLTGMPTSKDKGIELFLDYYTYNRDLDYKNKNIFGSYKTLLEGNYLPAMSYVIVLEKIKEIGAWTSGNTIEDWELWLKLSKKYKFIFVDQSVALYRWHESNSSKVIRKELIIDSMILLEKEKEFAFSENLHNIYFRGYFTQILAMRKYSISVCILKSLKQLMDFRFIKFILNEIYLRLNKK